MANNYLKFDIAMNMIKENLLRDLSASVIEGSKNKRNVFKNVSFSQTHKD